MKNVHIRLNYLNKKNFIIPTTSIPVLHNNHPYQVLGPCYVRTNDNNEYIGDLELNNDVSDDLYFYYLSQDTGDGRRYFIGLNLADEVYDIEQPTTSRLKDMTV